MSTDGGGRDARGRMAASMRAAVTSGSRRVARRIDQMFSAQGPAFKLLAQSHAAAVAGDTLVAVGLADTLFFSVPSAEARGNVTLYLLITLAPFAVLGPLLGAVYERFPGAYRGGLTVSAGARAVVAVKMAPILDEIWLFPLAFVLLVFSRLYGISRSSVLPGVLDSPVELVAANARLARLGVFASAVAVPVGALGASVIGPTVALVLAAGVFVFSTATAARLPTIAVPGRQKRPVAAASRRPPRSVRLARFATAGVRFLNGFLLLLVAFAFRDVDAGILDFGTLLAGAGLGFFLASVVTPALERRLAEEPIVVAALAVEAAAAFIAGQAFGLPAAAALALFAGFAWGAAKFGFDGLLQATVPAEARGRAFTSSETLFQISWVVGAVLPVAITIPDEPGLGIAGLIALGVQVVYVSALLVPLAEARRRAARLPEREAPRRDVTDLF